MIPFIGREAELKELNRLLRKKSASLVVVRGRRRIGKSRLIEQFAQGAGGKFYTFMGSPPAKETTAQSQRDIFSNQAQQQLGFGFKADDWYNMFVSLAKLLDKGRVILFFDEIQWMGSKDDDFLGKLKTAWDLFFSKHPELILVLCGSASFWVEKNIINSTGFLGRISLKITVKELPLPECNRLFLYKQFNRSPMEKFMLLAVTGGIPWYIDQIDGLQSAEDNIKRLCFTEDGVLTNEFKYIFHDLFTERRAAVYRRILEYLAQGPAEYSDISEHLDYPAGSTLSDYLDELEVSGFINRDYSWDFKSKETARISTYRLRDNYTRFYLRYIEPQLENIKGGKFEPIPLSTLPGWDAIMGLQFENLVMSNKDLVLKSLDINPVTVIASNPYLQRKTELQEGCQFDYLIQTKFNTLYACEVKFSHRELGPEVIKEVETKIGKLKRPRNFACLPVLIHVNGISKTVQDRHYFLGLIDFGELLEK